MKKYLIIGICTLALIITLLVLVTRSNKTSQVVCTKTTTSDKRMVTEEIIATLDKDNKVIDLIGVYNFNDKEIAESYCNLFKQTIDSSKQKYLACSDTKVTINSVQNIETDGDKSIKVIGMTKDDFTKLKTGNGYECK